jgi:hypothetical protein
MIHQDGDNVPTQAFGPDAKRAPPDHPDPGWAWWDTTRETPLPWEARARMRQRRAAGLRLPAPDDPAPATGRMLGVCAWAALLGLVGLAVAGRALVAVLAGQAPTWYEPTVLLGCVLGIALTAAAYLTVHHAWLPWALLAAATVPLVVNLASTAVAL